MPKKSIDNNVFIQDAKKIHGDKYDYSLINYKNNSTKVKIVCPIHGVFEQNYQKHCTLGRGCWECGKESCLRNRDAFDGDSFISKAKEVHFDFYDYTKSNYIGYNKNITITCPVHGDFEQTVSTHLQGSGCKSCGYIKAGEKGRIGKDKIFEKFINKHGYFYSYDIPEDVKVSDLIRIVCPIHGEFNQSVVKHYRHGCVKCGRKRTANKLRKVPEELEKVVNNVKRRIKDFIKKGGYEKTSSTSSIIGITWAELKKYLEDNPYNFKVDCKDLDIDHIIPISSAKTEEEVYMLNHYTNLQLLPKKYNQHIKRTNKFDKEHFEKWLIDTNYNNC